MSIEFTDIEKKFLTEFAKKQFEGADDNLGTCTPIHVVERKHKTFIQDESEEVWVDCDNNYEGYDSFDDLIEARLKKGEDLPAYDDVEYEDINDIWIDDYKAYCKAYGINAYSGRCVEHYQPVAFFFIRDEAKRYRDGYQHHNCDDCRIYTYGLGYSNNGDMPVFRNLLMKLGQELLKETETNEND